MAVVGMWLGLELRRRWRSLLVLTLLVALSAGVVLTAVAGARRADTATERLLAGTRPATVAVLPNEPGFDWAAVRALPGVEALAEFAVTDYGIDVVPRTEFAGLFPMDAAGMRDVERPVVLEGRLPDPGRADEVVVTPAFTRDYGPGVGDPVVLLLYDPATVDAVHTSGVVPTAPDGPQVPARVVGVVQSFWTAFFPVENGLLVPSAALLEQYRDNLVGPAGLGSVNALVRLTDGAAGLPAFRDGLAEASGRADIEMFDLGEEAAKVDAQARFEAGSLLVFGLVALAAAVVLVGQAVARYTASTVTDLQLLRSLGMGRGQTLVGACAAPVLASGAGVAAGAVLAGLASRWFPLGTAAELEPAPGLDVDPLVLGFGGPALFVLAAGGAVAAATVALATRAGDPAGRRSAVASVAARAGVPVPLLVGLRFALEPGRGRSAVPVRPALLGAVTGVLGVLAAFTFSAGVSDAAQNPARFGQTFQIDAQLGVNGAHLVDPATVREVVVADADVAAVLDVRSAVVDAAGARGTEPVAVFSHDPHGALPFPTVLSSGRLPRTAAEITLAPRTSATLGVGVGDALSVRGSAGSTTLTVTGIGFVPYAGHNNYDDGAWISAAGFDGLVAGFKGHSLLVALDPGADPEAAATRLAAAVGVALGTDPAAVPLGVTTPLVEATRIRNVELLPVVLGGFLALLAVGAVGHALATAVRRRRHDLAVLRALGMTRWQARGVVVTQATVLAVAGLILGVPIGLALGRVLWRFVADLTPLQYQAPVAALALLLALPVTVLLANALAAWPGRQAARLRIGHVLRAE